MGKIAPVSSKYIVHTNIQIDGVVDRPDVIGAVFGQTEGLLGSDLELRELQRSGRIGRIEVNVNTSSGRTLGEITIPSSLDKAETCIVAAALEVIQRIGPCNAKIEVTRIEDVRVSKRSFVIDRAKVLLQTFTDTILPDSQELADEVAQSVRVMEIKEFGKERLPSGPSVDESDEIIVVEGRADVITLLKHGIKNTIALNGTSVPTTVKELSRKKIITAFVDGDRGGDLIIRELINVAEIDFVCKAPDGKEVEELTKKEIHKALRGKVTAEQVKLELTQKMDRNSNGPRRHPPFKRQQNQTPTAPRPPQIRRPPQQKLTPPEKEKLKSALEDLFGTRGAYLFDKKLNVLGKVPVTELTATVRSVGNIFAIVMDSPVDRELVKTADQANVQFVVSMESRVKGSDSKTTVLTDTELA
jgi:DNA primase